MSAEADEQVVKKQESECLEGDDTTKEKEGVEGVKVSSANDWEHADLGDQSRKDKFLKLMGAAKGEHKGKIVIGDHSAKHKSEDPDKLNQGLEEQFQLGLDRKLKSGYKSHTGLGFSKEEESRNSPSAEVEATPDTDVVEERRRVTDDTANQDTTRDSTANGKTADEAAVPHDKRSSHTEGGDTAVPKKKPMMTFVKASDS